MLWWSNICRKKGTGSSPPDFALQKQANKMKVNRKITTLLKNNKNTQGQKVHLDKSEALEFVWELTEEIYSLSPKHDVQSRLQRDIVTIQRKRGWLPGSWRLPLAVHGFPRATGDIDIFVKPERDNAEKVYNSLADFGAPLENISVKDLHEPDTVLQIGVAPIRIDILTSIDGLSYDKASEDKEYVESGGLPIPFISKQKLIINKLATGREQDRIDADKLKNTWKQYKRDMPHEEIDKYYPPDFFPHTPCQLRQGVLFLL